MSEYIEREFEAYRKDDAEARAILDSAGEAGRDLTPEEDERFNTLATSAAAHKARADKLTVMDADNAELAEKVRSRIGEPTTPGSGDPSGSSNPDTSLVAAIMEKAREFQRTGTGEGTTELVMPIDLGRVEQRVVTGFDNGASLYTSDFSTNVAFYMRTESPWLANATIINANDGRPLILPNLSADPTAYTPGEGTAITAADPTLGTVTATPVSYKALAYISAEADEDEVVGYMPLLARSQARSLGLAFGSATTTAVIAAAANGGTATGLGGGGTATFFGADDLFTLQYGLAAPYRRNAAFVMSNGAIQKARKFKDLNGQYLWSPAVAPGQPDTWNGKPVYEDPYLAAPASVTKSVLFGDLSLWVIKQRAIRVSVSYEFAFNLDNIAIKSVYRAGGALPDSAGISYLVSATA